MMKKLLFLLLACMMILPNAFAAEDLTNYAVANGNVAAATHIDITAPYSGTLAPFDLESGDSVAAGQAILSMLVSTVYASEDGKVSGIFAVPGDDATALMARYGMVMSIEPAQNLRMEASTSGAYNSEANRTLHVGEKLYFEDDEENEEGVGRVIGVQDSNYVVDVLTGNFEAGTTLTLYRSSEYTSKSKVGKGKIVKRAPLSIGGQGRVAEILVEDGQEVKRGDALFTLMGFDADFNAAPAMSSPVDGVVAAVMVQPGQQVWKGQLLARIYPTHQLEIVAQVDEMDLDAITVGDKLMYTLDTRDDMVLEGVVTEISSLGVTMQNAAYYTVHIAITGMPMLGASASVYIPRN